MQIEYYLVNVTGPGGFTCPPEQCNVTTTNTIITNLECDNVYLVTVRAVNCIGVGNISNSLAITDIRAGEPLMPSCMHVYAYKYEFNLLITVDTFCHKHFHLLKKITTFPGFIAYFVDYQFINSSFVYTLNTKTPYSWFTKPQTVKLKARTGGGLCPPESPKLFVAGYK